jgi:sulfite exporter TauE/SafE
MSLPIHDKPIARRVQYILLYNLGRIITYSVIGAVFGLAGRTIFIGKYQQWLSVVIGACILVVLIFSIPSRVNYSFSFFSKYVKAALGNVMRAGRNAATFFTLGILNGLLPCGMVYFAAAAAIAVGNPLNSTVFMAAFGFGTLPAMISIAFVGKIIPMSWRSRMRALVPVVIALMGVMLILRGVNLGIPYISPGITNTPDGVHSCCHKH